MKSRIPFFSQSNQALANQACSADKISEIAANLNGLGFSHEAVNKIISNIQGMPGAEHLQGALKFLTEITASKSVREGYYQHSNYIAEYF